MVKKIKSILLTAAAAVASVIIIGMIVVGVLADLGFRWVF